MQDPKTRAEMTKELKTARNTLIVVGLIMFAMDMLFVHVLHKQEYEAQPELRTFVMIASFVLLAIFLVLGFFTARYPRTCLITGLVVFWLVQLASAWDNPRRSPRA